MLDKLLPLIILVFLFSNCTINPKPKNANNASALKVNSVKKVNHPISDSAKLVKHLDSMHVLKLPFTISDTSIPNWQEIGLSELREKPLFGLRSQLHPRIIGGAGIDDSSSADSTFNLTDTDYKGRWLLVCRKPNYFAILVNGDYPQDRHFTKLVTLSYNLKVIDAMNAEATDPNGNDRFHGLLFTTIYKNLKLILHYEHAVVTDPETYKWEIEEQKDDLWQIDEQGKFRLVKRSKDSE